MWSLVILSSSLTAGHDRLTVKDPAELLLSSDQEEVLVDRDRLQREARLVNVTSKEVCQDHYNQLELWEYWILGEDEETVQYIETEVVVDVTRDVLTAVNEEEPWISSTVTVR